MQNTEIITVCIWFNFLFTQPVYAWHTLRPDWDSDPAVPMKMHVIAQPVTVSAEKKDPT